MIVIQEKLVKYGKIFLFGVIAIALMLGVLLKYQGNIVSYAAPNKQVPNEFNLHIPQYNGEQAFITVQSADYVYSVPTYFADEDETIEVFTVDYDKEIVDGERYVKGNAIDDAGILYILNRPEFLESLMDSIDYVKSYIIQTSIWSYLNDSGAINYSGASNVLAAIVGNGDVTYKGDVLSGTDFSVSDATIISRIPILARNAEMTAFDPTWKVLRDDEKLYKSEDEKYYVTSLFKVTADDNYKFADYDVILSGIDGSYIVDGDGNKIGNTGLSGDTQFKVVVPIDKIDGVQKLKVEVVANYERITGYYYEPENPEHQRLIGVSNGIVPIVNDDTIFSLEVVGVPDTALNVSKYYTIIAAVLISIGSIIVSLIMTRKKILK